MDPAKLHALRFDGYGPRTLLDVGAHLGRFSAAFAEVFPGCAVTMVEPNPFCQDELSRLPFERHAVAAAAANGVAHLHLTREWLQSTGASLYRENTEFFRDEVLVRQEVDAVRLDDLFAGRRFDFVKIDTQGAELDVLIGGQTVLRQADYILLEISLVAYNQGAPPAEAVFEAMATLGFRPCDVTEFHRLRDVADGGLLQIDVLFERVVRRPSQNHGYAPMRGYEPLLRHLMARKARTPDFRVIDVGAAANPWSAPVLDATFDLNPCAVAPLHFQGDLNDPRSFEPVLKHVARHGRFAYAICSHTLEDLAFPAVTLEMLPRIADAGFVAVPSRYLECLRPEAQWRGYIHHRWVLDGAGEELLLVPKIPLTDYLTLNHEAGWAEAPERYEFHMHWRGAIAFATLNDGYLGPNRDAVVAMYARFFDRP